MTGWGDHDIYPPGIQARDKLKSYAGIFPVVEVDSTYHALLGPDSIQRWVDETPKQFRFVIKAYRELTGHGRPKNREPLPWIELVTRYTESLQPALTEGKLTAVLFQFPPWFDCTRDHVRYIRRLREAFVGLPLAVEFRHQSWFTQSYQKRTLQLLKDLELIHVVCDEPQVGEGCVPIVPVVTSSSQVLIRFHGRNTDGWNNTGQQNWRNVRYAYRYSEQELREWIPLIKQLKKEAKQVTILFNNNSQGDAAENAQQLIKMMGLTFQGLAPRQLGIFS